MFSNHAILYLTFQQKRKINQQGDRKNDKEGRKEKRGSKNISSSQNVGTVIQKWIGHEVLVRFCMFFVVFIVVILTSFNSNNVEKNNKSSHNINIMFHFDIVISITSSYPLYPVCNHMYVFIQKSIHGLDIAIIFMCCILIGTNLCSVCVAYPEVFVSGYIRFSLSLFWLVEKNRDILNSINK